MRVHGRRRRRCEKEITTFSFFYFSYSSSFSSSSWKILLVAKYTTVLLNVMLVTLNITVKFAPAPTNPRGLPPLAKGTAGKCGAGANIIT